MVELHLAELAHSASENSRSTVQNRSGSSIGMQWADRSKITLLPLGAVEAMWWASDSG